MGRNTQSGSASSNYDPMASVGMPDRSRSPAQQQNKGKGSKGARRRSQSRAASEASNSGPYASVLQHLTDITALPVRQKQKGTVRRHDRPVVNDPYSSMD